ncbi:TPA: hypothetical protein NJ450_004571 [Vibrio parahaemolyticus]|nr:hypothetical protein [Vibrio parahaemolyticus]
MYHVDNEVVLANKDMFILNGICSLYRAYKVVVNLVIGFLLVLIGFFFGQLYVLEVTQKLITQIKTVEMIEEIISIDDLFVSTLVHGLTLFFSITTCALVAFYKYPRKRRLINHFLKLFIPILKIPANFLLGLWFTGIGFSVYAASISAPLALPIFLVITILFGLPGLMFMSFARFQIKNSLMLRAFITPVIGVWISCTVFCIAFPFYDKVDFVVGLIKFVTHHIDV